MASKSSRTSGDHISDSRLVQCRLPASIHPRHCNKWLQEDRLWPLDRDVFQDCDFAASEPTDVAIPRLEDGQGESEGEGEDEHDSSDLDEADANQTTANVTAESHDVVDPVLSVQPSIPGSAEQHDHRHGHRAEYVTCAPAETPCQSHFAAEPSMSTARHVAITVLSPIPKAGRTERRPQSRSRGHTAVITSSPLGRTRERYWEKLSEENAVTYGCRKRQKQRQGQGQRKSQEVYWQFRKQHALFVLWRNVCRF